MRHRLHSVRRCAASRSGGLLLRLALPLLALVALVLLPAGCSRHVIRGGSEVRSHGDQPRTVAHEVMPGETLAMIADNYYGDPGYADAIARQNGIAEPDRLTAGSVVVLHFSEKEWITAQKRAAAMKPYNRGVELLSQDRLEDAESEFELALEMDPDFPSARYNLALVWIKRGLNEKAERTLATLVEARPADEDFRFALGHVLFLEARFEEAAGVFQQLLQLDNQNRRAAFGLARSWHEAGRQVEAIAAWEDYLRLDSTSSRADEARRYLAELRGE